MFIAKLDTVLTMLAGMPDQSSLYSALSAACYRPDKSGTIRRWFESLTPNVTLTTIQVNNRNGSVWAPTGRSITALRPTAVALNGSLSDFAGNSVVHSSAALLIVSNDWHTTAYYVETV